MNPSVRCTRSQRDEQTVSSVSPLLAVCAQTPSHRAKKGRERQDKPTTASLQSPLTSNPLLTSSPLLGLQQRSIFPNHNVKRQERPAQLPLTSTRSDHDQESLNQNTPFSPPLHQNKPPKSILRSVGMYPSSRAKYPQVPLNGSLPH